MLTIKRKPSESIQIGSDISITVVKCSASGVTLSIDAPNKVKVFRSELLSSPEGKKGFMRAIFSR